MQKQKEFHINCVKGDIGKYCLLTGDPGRCEMISKYFDNPKHIAYNREFNIYTGYLNGEKVSVCSTGIGGPSTAIAMEELHNCGADTFIRVGTCGGINAKVKAGDIIICTGAIRFEHTSLEYAPIEYPAVANFDIVEALKNECVEQGEIYHTGIVQSKDSFYGQHNPENSPVSYMLLQKWEAWKKLGVLASEMESAAAFVVANSLNCRCGTLLLTIWNQEREKLDLNQTTTHDISKAVEIAVNAIKRLIDKDKNN